MEGSKEDTSVFNFEAFMKQAEAELKVLKDNTPNDPSAAPLFSLAHGFAFALGSMAHSLSRIAKAQEAVAELAKVDIDATIEAGAVEVAKEIAKQARADETKRDFIGNSKIT